MADDTNLHTISGDAPAEVSPYDSPQTSATVTVKEMSADDRPRERALRYGISSLGTADLFAIILRTGTPGYPVTDLCRDMMRMNDGLLLNLERKNREQLMMLRGVGESKALQIEAVMEIVRRYGCEKIGERPQIKTSNDIYNYVRPRIANLPHEEMWVVMLNNANYVTGMQKVGEGGTTAVTVDVKKIVRLAILTRTERLIICHNHPSGIRIPSTADDNITRKLQNACTQCDILLMDHLIVTPDGYYSYNDSSSVLRR